MGEKLYGSCCWEAADGEQTQGNCNSRPADKEQLLKSCRCQGSVGAAREELGWERGEE